MEYRITLEVLQDRGWDYRRRRWNEEWHQAGLAQQEFDAAEAAKSITLALQDARARLGEASNEAMFLEKLHAMLS